MLHVVAGGIYRYMYDTATNKMLSASDIMTYYCVTDL